MENIKYNEVLQETMHTNELSSGIKCYIIPKTGYVEKQAAIAINYGSADNRFRIEGNLAEMPYGIAHFLEHKLFEDQDMNIFDRFMQQDANVNAFTNFTNTAYYFNCIDQFDENFNLLLHFTQNPYFTDENVEKEKGIITQEINMYLDNPHWQLFNNLQKAMYHQSPVRVDIAGSEESISQITRDMLCKCYDAFYYPGNAVIVCTGDIEPQHIYDMADKLIKPLPAPNLSRLYGSEPPHVKEAYVEAHASVSMPMFDLGFKEDKFEGNTADRIAATKLLTDIIAGPGSALYERLYNESLIDSSFSMEYVTGTFFGASIFSGHSYDPKKAASYILQEIKRLTNEGVSDERFSIIKKKHIGRFIQMFNSIDQIISAQVDMFSKGIDLFDLMQSFCNMGKEYVEERLRAHFRDDNYALSVILPVS